jgi:gamma-glutamyltranspeptidase / glutathione hydrolase
LYEGAGDIMAEQCTGRGARAVVTAAAPLAAAIGAEAIRAGGNAYDGVVAAGLAETVLLPPKCGLAGDLIALCLDRGDAAPVALLAIGGAPADLADVATAGRLTPTGPLSVGVPAAPAGYAALADRARLSLERLAAPAIALARNGFAWAPICTALSRESVDLTRQHNPAGTRFFPGGQPIAPGELVELPGLARVLEEFVARRGGLLEGPVGSAIVDAVQRRGGVLAVDDLVSARAEWVPAARGRAGTLPVWATPAPTHGVSLLDAVSGSTGKDSPAVVWDRVVAAIARHRATLGDPVLQEGTSVISAVHADGTVVVLVHSNSFPRFGSGIVVEDLDLVLANRAGRGFSSEVGHPNFPLAGRRPATTLHAWAAAGADGRPILLGATPGGVNQLPWNAQLLEQVAGGETRPGTLVTAPRWEWVPDGAAVVEDDLGDEAAAALGARAPGGVQRVGRWGLRSANQVALVPSPGRAVEAAADPRTGGAAVAV